MESLGTKGPIRMPDGTFFLKQSNNKKKSQPGICHGGHDDGAGDYLHGPGLALPEPGKRACQAVPCDGPGIWRMATLKGREGHGRGFRRYRYQLAGHPARGVLCLACTVPAHCLVVALLAPAL